MEIIATLRRAIESYKTSKETYKQSIERRDFSPGPRESFAKDADKFVAVLISSCKELIALLPFVYGAAYEGLQFVYKECFDLISPAAASRLPEDQKSLFDFVLKLSSAILQPRYASTVATLSAVPVAQRTILIEQLNVSVSLSNFTAQKLIALIRSFPCMEAVMELLLLDQLRYLGSLDEAKILHNIGTVYCEKGDLDRALRYYESALEMKQRHAPGSLDEAKTLECIGNMYRKKGDLDRALRYYESFLVITHRHAPGSLDEAKTLECIGTVYREKGDLDRALRYYESGISLE